MSSEEESTSSIIIELNVGGVYYATSLKTLQLKVATTTPTTSYFASKFSSQAARSVLLKDSKNKVFIDRDGLLFRYILDYLRNGGRLVLPENFSEKRRLRCEADFFGLVGLAKCLDELERTADIATAAEVSNAATATVVASVGANHSQTYVIDRPVSAPSSATSVIGAPLTPLRSSRKNTLSNLAFGCILVSYRGTFSSGRDGLNDVKFRKISRILVCGRVQLCREVFGETLNENRDPDHGVSDRYTSRYYLKHTFLEQAFDILVEHGFQLACVGATGANSSTHWQSFNEKEKNLNDNEENRWLHYNEFVFIKYP